MEKMKAIVIVGEKQLEVREVTRPECGKDEILVRIHACSICTTEQRQYVGEKKAPFPFVGGHELSGEVAQIGENIDPKEFPIGQKVVGRTQLACGTCYHCRRGEYSSCVHLAEYRYNGPEYYGYGGFAQYIVLNKQMVWPVGNLSYEEYSLVEPISCVLNSIDQADPKLGDDALIIGGGVMGQLHNILLKRKGVRTIMSEPDEARRKFALEHGCDVVINPLEENLVDKIKELTNGNMVESVFNTTAISAIAQSTVDLVSYNGTIVTYSSQHPDKPINVSPNWLHNSKVRLTGTVNPTISNFTTAINLLNKNIINVKDLVTEVYPMEDCVKAFEAALRTNTYRVTIKL